MDTLKIIKHLIVVGAVIASGMTSFAQNNIEQLLSDIEHNNTTLNALSKQLDARRLENRTGIFLDNPAFEYAYQWGDPASIGPKRNVSLRQSFAFPTVYSYQNQVSKARNEQLAMEYESHLIQIMLEARLLCYDLIFANAMMAEMEQRLQHARDLMAAYERMLESGETNQMEVNKVRINMASIRQQYELHQIDRTQALSELQRLNGGHPIELSDTDFPPQLLPADFERWYQESGKQIPALQWLQQEAEISRTQVSLARARSLPGFSAGYVSESLTHEQFRGWAVGVSIPLWENKNTVKLARANVYAMEETVNDQQVQYYNQLKSAHATAVSLQETLHTYRQSLEGSDHAGLLQQAWRQGEIGLISYLMELAYYYDSVDQRLETERELSRVLAVLNQYSNHNNFDE